MMPLDKPNAGTLGFSTEAKEALLLQHDKIYVTNDVAPTQSVRKAYSASSSSSSSSSSLDELLPDGLSDHIINHTISLSFQAKQSYPSYTAAIPRPIYLEYVFNYANVNEA
eukprot:12138214-Ditylum_brightwellii.AAC.1